MYYQMNRSNMAAVLAEDVYTPELRNPLTGGMSANRKSVVERMVNGLSRLFGQKH